MIVHLCNEAQQWLGKMTLDNTPSGLGLIRFVLSLPPLGGKKRGFLAESFPQRWLCNLIRRYRHTLSCRSRHKSASPLLHSSINPEVFGLSDVSHRWVDQNKAHKSPCSLCCRQARVSGYKASEFEVLLTGGGLG